MITVLSALTAAPLIAEDAVPDWPTEISRLRYRASQNPADLAIKQALARAYNNYGVVLSRQGQWAGAIQQLQEAIALDHQNEQFQQNLSTIYLSQAQDAYEHQNAAGAIEVLKQVIILNPTLAPAYVLRGEIEYEQQKLKEAQASWQRAVELDPTQTMAAQRLHQVKQELPLESKFERLSQAYFDIRYEEQIERPAGFDVRDALLEARRQVGSDFADWPKYKIVVLLYSAESFHALRQETPDWVAGQFDGKIRVPLPGAKMDQTSVKQVLFHEYTHAIIFDLTKGRCPLWLNEGLAEYEGRSQRPGTLKRLQASAEAQRLIPWQELPSHFSTTLTEDEVGLAYEQSYSVAAYLTQRYGFWRMRRVLKALAEGQTWEEILAKELHLKPTRLDIDWREWLPSFLNQRS